MFEDYSDLFALDLAGEILFASMRLNKLNQSWHSWLILSERATVFVALETTHFFPNFLAIPRSASVCCGVQHGAPHRMRQACLFGVHEPNMTEPVEGKETATPVIIEEWSAGMGVEKGLLHAGSCRVITLERPDAAAWCPGSDKALTAIQKKER